VGLHPTVVMTRDGFFEPSKMADRLEKPSCVAGFGFGTSTGMS
jgi:hypothetical protein